MGDIAWPLVTGGLGLVLLAAGTILIAGRSMRHRQAPGARSPVMLLLASLVLLAGVLLALYGLNLAGNLGR